MSELIILNRQAVADMLSVQDCISAIQAAMVAISSQDVSVPPRLIMNLHDQSGYFGLMPGSATDPAVFGAKVVSLLPHNPEQGRPAIQGFVCLFDHVTGAPIALIDGESIAGIRTACASALATDLLARKQTKTHGIFGTGVQALEHARAIAHVRPMIEEIYVRGRTLSKAKALAQLLEVELAVEVTAPDDPEEAARADIVSTVTGAHDPIANGDWVHEGAHLNLVGAHSPNAREVDTLTIEKSSLFVDSLESAKREAGDLLIPIQEGAIGEDQISGEIGNVILGHIPGRQSEQEITCYKSVGLFAQDLFAAHSAMKRASQAGCHKS